MKTWRGVRKICRICYYFLFTHTSPEILVERDRWRHNVIDCKFWRITLHGEDSVVQRRHAQFYTKVTFPDRGLLSSCLVCAFVAFSAATFPFRFRQTWIIWCWLDTCWGTDVVNHMQIANHELSSASRTADQRNASFVQSGLTVLCFRKSENMHDITKYIIDC